MADYRSSRLRKMRSIDPVHLMEWVREHLFSDVHPDAIYEALECVATTRDAASCGEEAAWLLATLRRRQQRGGRGGVLPVKLKPRVSFVRRAVEAAAEDTPLAKYWRARAVEAGGHLSDSLELMQQAANGGNARAMSEVGQFMLYDLDLEADHTAAFAWITKSAELKDPLGISVQARSMVGGGKDPRQQFNLFSEAARLGHTASMRDLLRYYGHMLPPMRVAVLMTRCTLLSGRVISIEHQPHAAAFLMGRELEGYEQLWGTSPDNQWAASHIELYLDVTHRARQAALYTVMALRATWGAPMRDVARVIAQLVYQSRETVADMELWQQRPKEKRARVN